MKIAIIHDWLITYAGSEKVLEQIIACYPNADLFSIVDFLPKEQRSFLQKKIVKTSFVQKLPFAAKKYRQYLPFMPAAVERFKLSHYDLIISSSHAVAKGVLTTPDQLHVCYLQARNLKYAYEDRFFYPHNKLTGFLEDLLLSRIRVWDAVASKRPDFTIANSEYVRSWHFHRHGVDSAVIHPPVETSFFRKNFLETKDNYFITVGRLEPYKRVDLIIEAFNRTGQRLVVVGSGSQEKTLRNAAAKNIEFLGYQNSQRIAELVSGARAFIFASREDFGITPVEAQACGTPVIALGKGGVLETIKGTWVNEKMANLPMTGVFFKEQKVESLLEAIQFFDKNSDHFSPMECMKNTERFSVERFRNEFKSFVDKKAEETFGR